VAARSDSHSVPEVDRDACLVSYRAELRIAGFQERESNLYNDVLLKYGNVALEDREALQHLNNAARRLNAAAMEVLRRRSEEMPAVPEIATSYWDSWQQTYEANVAWIEAQTVAIEALASGLEPRGEHVKMLLTHLEDARQKAGTEEKQILKRIGVSGNTVREIISEVMAETEDSWSQEYDT